VSINKKRERESFDKKFTSRTPKILLVSGLMDECLAGAASNLRMGEPWLLNT